MHRRRLGVLATLSAVALALSLTPTDPQAQAAPRGQQPQDRGAAALAATSPTSSVPTASATTATATTATAPATATATTATGEQPPNVVLITADDMREDDLEFMPRTRRLLGRAGVRFTDALSNYPLCCPARATLLTGQYAHNNGVRGNEWPEGGHRGFYESGAELETLPVWLQRAGYRTALVGKYLNYYGTSHREQRSTGPRYVPPGWDDWHVSVSPVFRYYCATVNHNGEVRRHPGEYLTDLYSELTTGLVDRYAASGEPFFIWASHVAPHLGVAPSRENFCREGLGMPVPAAPRHERMFPGMPLPASPALNEADLSDKGTYMADRKPVDLAEQARVHQSRLESLQALDESVADTVSALEERGVLDDTLVIFASDNGWLLGEHRAEKKVLPYEESLRVPILMRGPGLPSGVRRSQPVGLVDIPATVLDVAGATATKPQDGTSLTRMARDPDHLARRIMPIQAGPSVRQRRYNPLQPPWYYRGTRSSRHTYIAWQMSTYVEEEFYDLAEDPYQLEGRQEEPSRDLETARLYHRQLENCAGPACVRELPPELDGPSPARRSAGDASRPRVRLLDAPRGWVRTTRPTIRYAVRDRTDPASALSHWCSHQASPCRGEARLQLPGEGRHSWTIHVTDRAGNVGSRFGTLAVDLFAPRVQALTAAQRVVEGRRTQVSWLVDDSASGVAAVDTRIRRASLDGGFGQWRYPARLQGRDEPVRSTRVPRDHGTLCLQVRATDVAGRRSPWTGLQCRARAVDAVGDAGWRTVRREGWYAGTATTTRSRGATLSVPSARAVRQVRLVAATGPGMGRVQVSVGGTALARVDLDRPRRGRHAFVLPATERRGKVTVTVLSDGRPVWLDSVGVVRQPPR